MQENNLSIKELKEKYKNEGFESLTDFEKIKLFLSYSEKAGDIDKITEVLFETYGNINSALNASIIYLTSVCGLNKTSAILLKLIPIINNRRKLSVCINTKLNSTTNAKNFFSALIRKSSVEKIVVAAVTKNFSIIKYDILSYGEKDGIHIQKQKIYEFSVSNNAEYIFISHCHPYSDSTPSESDIAATIKIKESLAFMDIKLIDHIIIGVNSETSMYECFGNKIFESEPRYKTAIDIQEENQP